MSSNTTLNAQLDALIAGTIGLKDGGRFHEPNLDGTPGDYISFNRKEWPQGVGLYGLFRLWYHGWSFAQKSNFAQARWARGNAWITVGILDLLEIAPIDNGVRLYLLECLNAQVNTLIDLQAESGA